MKKVTYQLIGATGAVLATTAPALAATSADEGANAAQASGTPSDLMTQIRTITNTLLLFIGIAAVIMLIVGGFRYIFSAGDQSAVGSAKNTILFSVIGIVVALLAYAIVNFVLGQFS